jgi:hypothetical protein
MSLVAERVSVTLGSAQVVRDVSLPWSLAW